MRKSRKQGIYPAPVYVATFANGEVGRMSFYSPLGKPFDFDYGRRVLCGAWAHPQPLLVDVTSEEPCWCVHHETGKPLVEKCHTCHNKRKQTVTRQVMQTADGQPWAYDAIYPPRTDLIAGYVEHNGERYADPQFEPASEVAAKAKRDPLLRLVASIDKLDWADLERIQAAIDARLLATELPKAA